MNINAIVVMDDWQMWNSSVIENVANEEFVMFVLKGKPFNHIFSVSRKNEIQMNNLFKEWALNI